MSKDYNDDVHYIKCYKTLWERKELIIDLHEDFIKGSYGLILLSAIKNYVPLYDGQHFITTQKSVFLFSISLLVQTKTIYKII